MVLILWKYDISPYCTKSIYIRLAQFLIHVGLEENVYIFRWIYRVPTTFKILICVWTPEKD